MWSRLDALHQERMLKFMAQPIASMISMQSDHGMCVAKRLDMLRAVRRKHLRSDENCSGAAWAHWLIP